MAINLQPGTGGKIRTYEGECRQIYSLLCLTASLSQHSTLVLKNTWSHLSDSNRRPAVYKTAALTS